MWFKFILGLLLSGVAASAAVFYFFDKELDEILNDAVEDEHRKYLEECLHASTRENDN